MFEKLREYGLYIIIGVISLGILGMYFINTTNSKKGLKYFDDVQVGFLNATAINSTAKKEIKGTINDYVKLNNKSFGNYKINDDFGIVVLKGTNAKEAILDGQFNIVTKCDYLDKLYKDEEEKRKIVDEKNLIQIMIPVNGDNLLEGEENNINETYLIKKNKIITCGGKEIDIKGKSSEERGFFDSALFGLGFFKDKKEAKSFKDKYLSANGMLVESDTTPFVVFDVNGSIPNIMKTEYKKNDKGSGTIDSNETGGIEDNNTTGTEDPAAEEDEDADEYDKEENIFQYPPSDDSEEDDNQDYKKYNIFINFENLEHYKENFSSTCEHKIVEKNGKKMVEIKFGEKDRCKNSSGKMMSYLTNLQHDKGFSMDNLGKSDWTISILKRSKKAKQDLIIGTRMTPLCDSDYITVNGHNFYNTSKYKKRFSTGTGAKMTQTYSWIPGENKFVLKNDKIELDDSGNPIHQNQDIDYRMAATCGENGKLRLVGSFKRKEIKETTEHGIPEEILVPTSSLGSSGKIIKENAITKDIRSYKYKYTP